MFYGYKDVSVYSKCDYFTIRPYIFKFIMSSFQGVRNGSSKVSFHSEGVGERAQKPENERGFVLERTLEFYGKVPHSLLEVKAWSSEQSPLWDKYSERNRGAVPESSVPLADS